MCACLSVSIYMCVYVRLKSIGVGKAQDQNTVRVCVDVCLFRAVRVCLSVCVCLYRCVHICVCGCLPMRILATSFSHIFASCEATLSKRLRRRLLLSHSESSVSPPARSVIAL